MQKSILYIACCFLMLFAPSILEAANNPKKLLAALAANDSDKTAEVVEEMIASGSKDFYPLLNGIQESSIYTLNGKKENAGLVIGVSTGEEKEGKNLYKLLEVYPEATEIVDAKGKPLVVSADQLEEITISRKVRLIVQRGAIDIQLYHWDAQKRKLAMKTFATAGSLEDVKKLEAVVEEETDPRVIREGKEAIFLLLLKSPEKSVRLEAVEGLEENKGNDVLNVLAAAQKVEKDAEVSAAIESAVSNLESRNSRIEIGQNLFTGLSLGSILILMALGLAVIYGLMGIINMAHGEFMMIGAYTTFVVQGLFAVYFPTAFDYYFWLALPASFLVAGLIGIVVEFLVIRHLYNKPLESLLATWGVSLILIQLARSIFGDLTAVKAPSFATGGFEIVPQLTLPYNRLFIIGCSLLVIVAVQLLLSRTNFGLKIRAVTQNPDMSACLGVPTKKVNRAAFFIGTGIAGIAGWAITLVGNVVPDMGQTYIVDSFLVVVTGGVGKLIGTVFSGLGMGFLTKMFEPVFQAVYGKVLILVLVILFLQVKPTGLFPAKGRSED